MEIPDPDRGNWQAGLRAMMASTHRVLPAHPDLVPLYLARQGDRGPNAERLGEVMLALLRRGGVTGPSARDAQRALIVHAIGSAAFTARRPLERGEDEAKDPPRPELIRTFERSLGWAWLPGHAGPETSTRYGRSRRPPWLVASPPSAPPFGSHRTNAGPPQARGRRYVRVT